MQRSSASLTWLMHYGKVSKQSQRDAQFNVLPDPGMWMLIRPIPPILHGNSMYKKARVASLSKNLEHDNMTVYIWLQS